MATDLGGVLSAATEYGDARAAEQKAEDDVVLAAVRAELDASRAEYAAHMETHTPPVEVWDLVDFTDQSSGLYTRDSLVGEGVDRTIYRMIPHSSTRTPPTVRNSGTNPLKLIRAGGGLSASVRTADTEVGGFTLEGSDQGHLYGGLLVGWSTSAHLHDVRVVGVPGNDSTPPGETFAVAMWHADDCLVEHVDVDGAAAWATGEDVTATGIGINSCARPVVRDCKVRGARYGMGIAVWDSTDAVLQRLDLRGNRRGINFEQAHPGTILIEECDLRDRRDVMPHLTVNSALGSSEVRIVEPVWDEQQGPLWIGIAKVGANYPAGGNRPHTQRLEDVTVIKDGVDITKTSRVRFGY